MKAGDHLVSPRVGYTHHGIYAGNDRVVHYSGFSRGLTRGVLGVTTLSEFSNGNGYRVKEHPLRIFSHEEALQLAHSRCGEDLYDVASPC